MYTLTQRGRLHGTVGSSRGYFLMPYSCLTSGVHAVHVLFIIFAAGCLPSLLLTTHPRRTEPVWRFSYPTVETPGCYPTLLTELCSPLNPSSLHRKMRGKTHERTRKRKIVPSVSPSLAESSLIVLDLTLVSPDIETVVSKCTTKSGEVCLKARKDMTLKLHKEGTECHINIMY